MYYTIKNEVYELTVSSLGAEMVSLKSANKELVWNSTNKDWWSSHAPFLFPACGRIKDNRYVYGEKTYTMNTHGFIKSQEFTVSEKTDTCITLSFESDDETRENYPFDFVFKVKYELIGKKVLISVTIENTDNKTLPYMFGWHPGFNLLTNEKVDIEDYNLDFGNVDKLSWIKLQNVVFASKTGIDYPITHGSYRLNEKEIYDNDTMIFKDHNNELKLYANGAPFSLDMKWSDNLPVLCIWKEPDNAAKFICIEPWSGTPNDGDTEENFETRDMVRLAPKKSDEYIYSLEFNI